MSYVYLIFQKTENNQGLNKLLRIRFLHRKRKQALKKEASLQKGGIVILKACRIYVNKYKFFTSNKTYTLVR